MRTNVEVRCTRCPRGGRKAPTLFGFMEDEDDGYRFKRVSRSASNSFDAPPLPPRPEGGMVVLVGDPTERDIQYVTERDASGRALVGRASCKRCTDKNGKPRRPSKSETWMARQAQIIFEAGGSPVLYA